MYYSGKWFPHKSLTDMKTEGMNKVQALNTFLFDTLVKIQDRRLPYDIDYYGSLGLYLKSFTYE